ncbi:MAG TPA: sigma 54-interacting transcriptional regulator [Anaeromyxobacteraceae bacterium]|jgi:two-component system NtrC family response regulator
MRQARILVIDADQVARLRLRAALLGAHETADVASAREAAALLGAFQPDGVLAVLRAAGDGAAVLRALRERGSDAALVVAAPSDLQEAAVEALRQGADAWVSAPVAAAMAALVLAKALEKRWLAREAAALRDRVRRRHTLVGSTPALRAALEVVRRAAPTKATVLVCGEPGTGRSLVGQLVHEASPRRERPLARVCCAGPGEPLLEAELFGCEAGTLPHAPARAEGAVAAASGGTLHLHEVGAMPARLQVRLLRLLQHGEYERAGGREILRTDVRVVASTSRDLAGEVRAGRMRRDLYYRLSVVQVELPPLRGRKGDIPALVEHFLELAPRAPGQAPRAVSQGALSALRAHDWPGNVLELERAVERAEAHCEGGEIAARHLAPAIQGRGDEDAARGLIPGASLQDIEREAILRTLDEVGGSTAKAAQVLGVSVRKIQYKLKEYRSARGQRRREAADLAR